MKQKVMTIRDEKAEIYINPFLVRTTGEAERVLTDLLNNPQTNIAKYPESFSLWELGEYNDNTGIFDTHEPRHVINAIDLRRAQAPIQSIRLGMQEVPLDQ